LVSLTETVDIPVNNNYFSRPVMLPSSNSHRPTGSLTAVDAALMAVLFFLTLAVYGPVVHFPFISFDDPLYVSENPHVLSGLSWKNVLWTLTANAVGNWQPVTLLSYLVDIRAFGPAPGPIHLENALLHAMNAAGWFSLLQLMTGRRAASFFIGAFFAVHPAHVESVAWIAERKDVLSMCFMILSLFAYWRYTQRPRAFFYGLALLFFALALMAKVMMVTLPGLMLLLDLWPLGRVSGGKVPIAARMRWLLLEKVPFILLAAVAGAIAVKMQSGAHAAPSLAELSIGNRIGTTILGYTRYLGMAFCPRRQSALYPYQFDPPTGAVIASGLLLIMISFLVIRSGRRHPYLPVGWFWFLGTMLPVIGLMQVGDQAIADRYTYLPFVGLSIAVCWWIADLVDGSKIARAAAAVAGLMAVAGCIIQTRRYLPCWSDSVSLFSQAERVNESLDWNIEARLAEAYARAGQPSLAIEHYDLSLQQRPTNVRALSSLANLLEPHFPAAALPRYESALKLTPTDPRIRYNYGLCLESMNRNAQAAVQFRRVLLLDPGYTDARQALQRVTADPVH
jgi:hypothetical protein